MSQKILIYTLRFLFILILLSSCDERDYTNREGKVHIRKSDSGFEIIKDNKPFKVKGVAGQARYIPELAAAGGNTIRLYDTLNLNAALNTAKANNISVIIDIPIPPYNASVNYYASEKHRKMTLNMVKKLINRYKGNEAVLMWVLGNEINFPHSGDGGGFVPFYSELIDVIHKIDPDHPVTTTIPQAGKRDILNLYYKTDLDLISINIFGGINTLKKQVNKISLLWDGPYLLSEWSDEGPWTEDLTRWGAPLEPTSEKKAERFSERYHTYIDNLSDNCLGSLAFYWGNKQERTHTWFSLFSEQGSKTQMVYELERIFKMDSSIPNLAPRIDYILLNQRGAQESQLLFNNDINIADVYFSADDCSNIQVSWEILPEVWNTLKADKDREDRPANFNHLIVDKNDHLIKFITPDEEGPYRLFVYIDDNNGTFATANLPFYVINQPNAKN
ncbi:cellulase family glycosylhydrolase [Robertkochia solimangrovi]|uniref:cellulase family glycosylhydrolase n=1 Tax=Robertkochia solimangrovi TaxID=2213046 RepID=UPI001180FF76|nr:cellulase family glycosylhydrolase [Robertkochia solimangrovi]TRZ44196.1 hypothetical protein DMZ48_06695 [Robertkochia solimangrovi]